MEVWSFLCFDAVPGLCFPLGLEREKGQQLYIKQLQAIFSEFSLKAWVYSAGQQRELLLRVKK